jgi:hypothetical protein
MQRIEAFTEISRGTLNSHDLAHALMPYARRYLGAPDVNALQAILDSDEPGDDDLEIINETIDALQDYAAPYCYIGSHEADGALLGCWPCVESALDDPLLPRVKDTSEIEADYMGFALHVNDHGNVTLYECHGPNPDAPDYCLAVELWGVV